MAPAARGGREPETPNAPEGKSMADSRASGKDQIDVRYVARLARLNLTEDEVRTFQGQLDHILNHVRQINTLNLAGIEPTSHARVLANVFRKDAVKPGLDRDEVLRNAPATANGQFAVPKIVE
jgi:aspartyl-tRNA(Asn)/glutamyl-tRNA(Gln) amidotransferase subunit C